MNVMLGRTQQERAAEIYGPLHPYALRAGAVKAVPCRNCHAREFRPCRFPNGRVYAYGHATRRIDARMFILSLSVITTRPLPAEENS